MATKQNIFSVLPQHGSDSDDDDFHKSKTKKAGEKKDTRRPDEKTQAKPAQRTGTAGATGVKTQQEKEQHSRAKEVRKTKGVSDQPHPLDRQSGTGSQAYGTKPKKAGAGKGNWGKQGREDKGAPEEAGEEDAGVEEEEEEKPEGKTLKDYYQTIKFVENKPQINETKAKITSEQLLKELGKSTKLESKRQKEVDDHRVGKKKGALNVNHHAGISTEFADLLGFRTGFIDKEYRARGEDGGPAPKKTGPRTGGKGEKEENAKEAESPTKQAGEGGEEAGAETAEKGTTEGGKERREGGQRGGRGGYKGGDRPQYQGGRKPYEKKPEPAKVNLSDESAFPKLG